MDYTKLDECFDEAYYERFIPPNPFKAKICREDPVKFAYWMLDVKLWKHQTYLVDSAMKNRYSIWCLPRQTGKSVTIAALSLWAAWYNKYSNLQNERVGRGTSVYIMSRTEDQAKELLLRIRELIKSGDERMSKLLRHNARHMNDFFSSQLTEPNNKFQITFKNGSFIKCVPPTDTVRGKSADWFFIDEAAFLKTDDPDKLYNEAIEPTIRQTDGKMIMSSTPRGQQGFFYKLLDPFHNFLENDFNKVWFHYTILDDLRRVDEIIEKEKQMRSEGNGKAFEQEYEAKFVSSSESFFKSDVIDDCSSNKYSLSEYSEGECIIGIDYGMVNSRTAIAISYYDNDEGRVVTCYVKRFKKGKDLNEVANNLVSKCRRISTFFLDKDEKGQKYGVNGLEKFKDMLYETVIAEYVSKMGFGNGRFDYALANELKAHAGFYDSLINKVKKEECIERTFTSEEEISGDKYSSTQHIFIEPQTDSLIYPKSSTMLGEQK